MQNTSIFVFLQSIIFCKPLHKMENSYQFLRLLRWHAQTFSKHLRSLFMQYQPSSIGIFVDVLSSGECHRHAPFYAILFPRYWPHRVYHRLPSLFIVYSSLPARSGGWFGSLIPPTIAFTNARMPILCHFIVDLIPWSDCRYCCCSPTSTFVSLMRYNNDINIINHSSSQEILIYANTAPSFYVV